MNLRLILGVVGAQLLVLVVVAPSSIAATSSSVVGATVPSATTLDASGCETDTADVTDFGVVLAGTSAVTSLDCVIGFGSSNDTAMLRTHRLFPASNTFVSIAQAAGLDFSYTGDGIAQANPAAGAETTRDVAVQADGKVVGVALATGITGFDTFVARWRHDGSLDPGFGTGGTVQTDLASSGGDYPTSVAVQSDGAILVTGWADYGALDHRIFVLRYLSDGTLDPSWATGGIYLGPAGGRKHPFDVAVDAAGRVYIAGTSIDAGSVILHRFTSSGSLDFGWNGTGQLELNLFPSTEAAYFVLPEPGGTVVWGGELQAGATRDVWIGRRLSDGSPDLSFNGTGTRQFSTSTNMEGLYGAIRLADGTYAFSGYSVVSDGAMLLVRTNADGSPFTSFGTNGVLVRDATGGPDTAWDVVQLADGSLAGIGTSVLRVSASTGAGIAGYGTNGLYTPGGIAGIAGTMLQDGRLIIGGNAGGQLGSARMAPGASVTDWSSGVADWTTGSNTFGACLRAVSGTGVVGGWVVDADANCTATNTDPWNAIASNPGDVGAVIARSTTAGVDTAAARLRFGFRAATTQAPGRYLAPLVLEVVAPAA